MYRLALSFSLKGFRVIPRIGRSGVVKIPGGAINYFAYQISMKPRKHLATVCCRKLFASLKPKAVPTAFLSR